MLRFFGFLSLLVLPLTSFAGDEVVVDGHVHVSFIRKTMFPGMGGFAYAIWPDGDEILRLMDENGVDQAILLSRSFYFFDEKDAIRENDYLASVIELSPERLFGLCSAHVKQDWAIQELERCLSTHDMSGIKLHLGDNALALETDAGQHQLDEILDTVSEILLGGIALIHLPDIPSTPKLSIEIARRHPTLSIVVAHSFAYQKQLKGAFEALRQLQSFAANSTMPKNLFFEMSGLIEELPQKDSPNIAKLIQSIGASRFVFGSDLPFRKMKTNLKQLKQFLDTQKTRPFSKEEREQILGKTLSTLLSMRRDGG